MKKTYNDEELEILMRVAFMMGTECPPFPGEGSDETPDPFARLQYLSNRCTQALQIIRSNESDFLKVNSIK